MVAGAPDYKTPGKVARVAGDEVDAEWHVAAIEAGVVAAQSIAVVNRLEWPNSVHIVAATDRGRHQQCSVSFAKPLHLKGWLIRE